MLCVPRKVWFKIWQKTRETSPTVRRRSDHDPSIIRALTCQSATHPRTLLVALPKHIFRGKTCLWVFPNLRKKSPWHTTTSSVLSGPTGSTRPRLGFWISGFYSAGITASLKRPSNAVQSRNQGLSTVDRWPQNHTFSGTLGTRTKPAKRLGFYASFSQVMQANCCWAKSKDFRTSFCTGRLQSEPASIPNFSALRRWYKINLTQPSTIVYRSAFRSPPNPVAGHDAAGVAARFPEIW